MGLPTFESLHEELSKKLRSYLIKNRYPFQEIDDYLAEAIFKAWQAHTTFDVRKLGYINKPLDRAVFDYCCVAGIRGIKDKIRANLGRPIVSKATDPVKRRKTEQGHERRALLNATVSLDQQIDWVTEDGHITGYDLVQDMHDYYEIAIDFRIVMDAMRKMPERTRDALIMDHGDFQAKYKLTESRQSQLRKQGRRELASALAFV